MSMVAPAMGPHVDALKGIGTSGRLDFPRVFSGPSADVNSIIDHLQSRPRGQPSAVVDIVRSLSAPVPSASPVASLEESSRWAQTPHAKAQIEWSALSGGTPTVTAADGAPDDGADRAPPTEVAEAAPAPTGHAPPTTTQTVGAAGAETLAKTKTKMSRRLKGRNGRGCPARRPGLPAEWADTRSKPGSKRGTMFIRYRKAVDGAPTYRALSTKRITHGALPRPLRHSALALHLFLRALGKYESGLYDLVQSFMPDACVRPDFVLASGLRLVTRKQYKEAIPILRAALPMVRKRHGKYSSRSLAGYKALEVAKTATDVDDAREAMKIGAEGDRVHIEDKAVADTPELQWLQWAPAL
eukprot:CAMPEP_0182926906 /NCGR_PEP_ID=MMETSP0105_2-20130417/12618_1 /TAXON_ID=81532 ORGANISM="Acanthoeca-like sp., Strain 10tr" /NCGR_SAMPLE_ID=MMETSP0105_2 /ASSEMBLY_ACC=CAM_ASM_000205 /LENGTH=355 /DNA_ID=CAMNT_0025064825 /DNA_START=82 /DNA_END=1149 /DNA_ORIENTATION=+